VFSFTPTSPQSIRLKLAFFDSSPVVAPVHPGFARGLPMVVIAAAAGVGKAIQREETVPRSLSCPTARGFSACRPTGVGRTGRFPFACIGGR